jgi:dTDP-4-amino-4,6-dideoxygalactose transaminase
MDDGIGMPAFRLIDAAPPGCVHAHHLVVGVAACRVALAERLAAAGVSTGCHYRALPTHRAFYGCRAACPVAMSVWPHLISLPCWVGLSLSDVDRICNIIQEFYRCPPQV